ncbi:MAG: transposase [Conexibacter sp.]|nr:transposase [Conexibacter sp.]
MLFRWIAYYNAQRPHSALNNRTPDEVFLEGAGELRWPDVTKTHWMLPSADRVVGKSGVRAGAPVARDYMAPELVYLVGETVTVHYMPHDARRVYVYRDDDFLCDALPQGEITEEYRRRIDQAARGGMKNQSDWRRGASRRQRAKIAPVTEPGPVERVQVTTEDEAIAADAGRAERHLDREAADDLLGLED